jgi:hypothetical protein
MAVEEIRAPRVAALEDRGLAVRLGGAVALLLLPCGRDFLAEPLVALGLAAMVERALAGRELQARAALAFAVLAPRTVRRSCARSASCRRSIAAIDDPRARENDHRRYLVLWQAGAVREFGALGLLGALLASAILLTLLLRVARPLVALLRGG